MKAYHSFEEAVREIFDGHAPVASPVSGGDINKAYRLAASGKTIFMKANRTENVSFFDAEARGLNAIASTGTIRTPEVLGIGSDSLLL